MEIKETNSGLNRNADTAIFIYPLPLLLFMLISAPNMQPIAETNKKSKIKDIKVLM